MRNTDAKFVGVSSGVLSLVSREKVDYAELFTKADQKTLSTHHDAHFFDEIHVLLPFPSTRNINPSSSAAPTLTIEQRHTHFSAPCCMTMPLLRTVTKPSLMGQMRVNYLRKSDNFDTQRLSLNANLRVVSAIYPHDRTVTQSLHNKQNTDELTGNLAETS